MNNLTYLVDLHKSYEVLKEENVIFSHQGALDGELIDVIIQLADKKLVKANARIRTKKKIINILIECLQNSFHYTNDYADQEEWDELHDSPFLIISRNAGVYYISTGNFITLDRAKLLKKRVEDISELSDEELQDYYIRALDKDELPKQGGAGLGLVDIIRRSKHNVTFEFIDVDEKYQRFNMLIKVA